MDIFVLKLNDHEVSFNLILSDLMVVLNLSSGVVNGKVETTLPLARISYKILLERGYKRRQLIPEDENRFYKLCDSYAEKEEMESERRAENSWLAQAEYCEETQHQMYMDDMKGNI